jgi:hypothetical protein
MSTRSRRTRSGEQHHAQADDIRKEPIPNTEAPIPGPKTSKVTFSDPAIPLREPITISAVLHVPSCSYTRDEIHFVLWYTLTTTLSPDKIAELFNHFFKPAQLINRWAIADIVHVLETRWEANGKSFGRGFRIKRPTAHGTCACDFETFHIDCVEVKRTTKTRQNQKYLSIATSLWDQSAAELVLCPRGNRKEQRHAVVTRDTQPFSSFIPRDALLASLHEIYLQARTPTRVALTFTFWLSILHLWSAPPETLSFTIQRTLSSYLHTHLTNFLAIAHLLLESILDGFPTFSHLRMMPFGEFAWQAFNRLWQMMMAIAITLELCRIMGIILDTAPTNGA